MNGEDMLKHFGEIKCSLWHYWKGKKPGRVPHARLMPYALPPKVRSLRMASGDDVASVASMAAATLVRREKRWHP